MTFKSSRVREQKGLGGNTALALFVFSALIFFLNPMAAKEARADAGDHMVGFGFGQVLLMGDFSKNFSDSLGFNFMYDYEASPMFGLLANFNFSNHSSNDGSKTLNIKGISPDLKMNLAYIDKLVIYAFTGFGINKVNETIDRVEGSVWTLGFDLGAGFNLNLDKHFAFGTSLGFHNLFGKTDTATVSGSMPNGITIGGTYLGIFLNLFYIF